MGIFNKRRYVLVNLDTKEDVYESKELLPKEVVLEDIESENLEDVLYRLEERVSGRKVRNTWVMRKARKPKTPEELAEKSREDAEAFIAHDAQDIKERVEAHKAFADKVKQTYGIEAASGINNIKIPTGKDGTLGIMEAIQIATAESAYEGIRENPSEVAASVKSIMNMIPTFLAGVSQLIATRITESNRRNKIPPATKEDPAKEDPKEPTKKAPLMEATSTKVPTIKKETISEGITKTTFVPDASTDSITHYKTSDTSTGGIDGADTISEITPTVTYEQYKSDMLGNPEEELEEEIKTE